MAESVKVIDPNSGSGYDYTSLFDWEAAQQADIDTSNTIAVAKCRCTGGTADTTAVTIDGWTTSAADYIKVWTDTAESYRHNGTYQTGNKYRHTFTATSDSVQSNLSISEQFVRVIGIQFQVTNNGYTWCGAYISGASLDTSTSLIIFDSCIVKSIITGASRETYGLVGRSANTANHYFINNIVYNNTGATGQSISGGGQNSVNIYYNNSLVDCTLGIGLCALNTDKVKNNLFSGCTTAMPGTAAAGSGYNVTNLASLGYTVTGGATGDRLSKSFTFADSGADDFHLAAADTDCIGYGTNLYNDANYPFQTDIDGQDRGGAAASWDIGADEYVSSTAIEQEGLRARKDDGSESAATFLVEAQDADFKAPLDTNLRIRFLVNTTGDVDTTPFQLEYRKSGDTPWNKAIGP